MPFLEAVASAPSIKEEYLWAIVASPLIAWGLIVLYFRKVPKVAGYLAILGIGIACALSYVTLFNVNDANGGLAILTTDWFTRGPLIMTLVV